MYRSSTRNKQPFSKNRHRKPKNEEDMIWYDNSLVGVNTLATMMKGISLGVGLSQTYTNHSVRATAITLWSNANVPSRHIMSISGHANEQSISSYNSRPSVKQLKNCSNILSNALVSKEANSAVVPVTPASISNGSRALAFPSCCGQCCGLIRLRLVSPQHFDHCDDERRCR